MGQKVHPKGLRIGIIKDWDARWYARKQEFVNLLHEDVKLRRMLKRRLYSVGLSRIEIERATGRVRVTLHVAKPGMVIGKGGAGVEDLRKEIERFTGKQASINIVEVKMPELDATLVAENIAQQLEKRISFRRAMKQSIGRAMRLGARGIRVVVSGRLGGAEIARRERDWEGTVPLHTLRADIDYGTAEANTTYGKIGVKAWVYRGEVLPGQVLERRERPERGDRRGGDRRGGGRPGGPGRGDDRRGQRPGLPQPTGPRSRVPAPAPAAAPAPADTEASSDGAAEEA